MIIENIVFSVMVLFGSVILLCAASSAILKKGKIIMFVPFVLIGVFFSAIASMGFFTGFSYSDLFLVRIVWCILVVYMVINIRRRKWI